MVAIVRREDGSAFQTVAFAIVYGKDWDTEYFVLNEERKLERVYAYRQDTREIVPQVWIVDAFCFSDGWLEENRGAGYKEFLHNPRLLEGIRQGKEGLFDETTMILWKSMAGAVGSEVDYGPIPVDDDRSRDNLMKLAGHFHDACVLRADRDEKNKKATLILTGIWGIAAMKLAFEGVTEFRLAEEWECDYFFGASIFFPKDGGIVFAGCEDITSVEECSGLTYVRAARMSYSFELGENEQGSRSGPMRIS